MIEFTLTNFISVLIYLATFLFSAISVYYAEKSKKHKVFWIIAAIIPALTAAFRQSGTDLQTYQSIFGTVKRYGKLGYNMELGWLFFNKISPSFEFLLFISAFVFCSFCLLGIKQFVNKNQYLAWLICLLCFYPTFINIMRQMIAVAIGFYACSFLYKRRKIKPFIFYVLLATVFHRTALILFAVPLLLRRFRVAKHYILFLMVVTLAAFIMAPIFTKVIDVVTNGSKYSNMRMEAHFGFLLYMIPPLIPIFLQSKSFLRDKSMRAILYLYAIVIVFQVLEFRMPYFDRLSLYFQVFIVTLIPQFINGLSENKYVTQRSVLTVSNYKKVYVIWYVFHFLVLSVLMNGNLVMPYRMTFT